MFDRVPVRLRITLVAALVLSVALALGAVLVVQALRSTLHEQAEDIARTTALGVAAQLRSGTAPSELDLPQTDELIAQVVVDGEVVAASDLLEGAPPMIGSSSRGGTHDVHVQGEEDDFVVSTATAGPATVLVASTAENVEEASRALAGVLLVGAPVLVLLLAVATWFVVGRALSPVEAIRRQVETINVSSLDRRVPVVGDDEVGRLARTMNAMLARVDGAVTRQRRFVADASHELRSPLASLRQHAEVAVAHPERADAAQLADNVLAESVRMQGLVEDLLLLARVDEGLVQRQAGIVDLDDLVMAEAARLRDRVQVGTPGLTAVQVPGVAGELDRVLRNLGDNAARHARSRVEITIEVRDGSAVLAVDDDGEGIAAADRSRVVERFVRLDDARDRDTGGSGLGLSIVHELVGAHGGRVVITGSRLGGARVEVHLPFSERSGAIRHGGTDRREDR